MPLPFFNRKRKKIDQEEENKNEKGTWYKVCPRCLSPELKYVQEFTSGWLTPAKYYCKKCEYSGQLFMEIDIDIFDNKSPEEIRMMLKEELTREPPSEIQEDKE
ncbi:MAG: hypothetical protein ACXAC7_13970 [Candidatus Hodarchaeales archaeon]|jgi:transposase-like protein